MVVCLPREKLPLFLAYVNSCLLTARVEYFAIIGSRLIAECFVFIFQSSLTAADIKKFRAYRCPQSTLPPIPNNIRPDKD